MALRIVDGGDVTVRNLVVVVYGPPNLGKTSLALTASKPVLLDFDRGSHRAGNKAGKAIVPIDSWADVDGMEADDFAPYDTVIVDTVGAMLTSLSEELMTSNDRNRAGAGQLSLAGYGALKGRFGGWLSMVRSYGKDIVLVAHGEEIDRNGVTADRIDAMGGSKQLIYQKADLMGRIYLTGNTNQRLISFTPTKNSFGKNVGLPDYTLLSPAKSDSPYLAKIMAEGKRLINDNAERENKEIERRKELRADIETYDPHDARDWNRMMALMLESGASRADKAVLMEVAAAKGVEFDNVDKQFLPVQREVAGGNGNGAADEDPF